MLSNAERDLIYRNAYLPEHLPYYVEAISGAQPYLQGAYLCYYRKKHLIFIGYPLGKNAADCVQAYESACEQFQPNTVAIIAPEIWLSQQTFEEQPRDSYYRLDLPPKRLDPALAYMVRRAQRELYISYAEFTKDHGKMVKTFLTAHKLTSEQKYVFKHIPDYLKNSDSARLIEARKATQLAAFTIADLGSADYAFYMFNFRSTKDKIPGASDLLFNEMVQLARLEGKKAINLGLGIHTGIRHFKEKWGGVPFLSYASALVHREPPDLAGLANKL